MKKQRIGIMIWPFILAVVAVAATYSTIPGMTPQQLEAEMNQAILWEQQEYELAAALFARAKELAVRGMQP